MSKTFEQGKDEVAKLCKYFTTNQKSFFAPGIKEAHVRQSLIDPLFEALGWDVRNAAMAAPQYREVIPEDSLDVEGHQKAPDYTFRVGTLPKFYAEAKKCGININADPGPAYQLRRYGFSAKLALSILTDFEEFGVYDCASRPRPSDKASHARIQYLLFTEYPDRWREIWDVFSREAVWSGAFDQYAASKRKRGTSEVDSEFLKDIEGWRNVLARNLALRNRDLSVDDLNAAVQRIIDRIIFLRMAEDRGLESNGQLLKLCERSDIYDRFMSNLCRKADEKYNSGLFHFHKEPGISDIPDTLTPSLAVDDKVLKPILQSLYFEYGCPYHFGVLPVEILGTVYERFLGKVIRLTAGHQAKVEEKPEVRKAGGVYYTPAYIVNYIVQNTVGKQIEGKSPAKLAGGKTMPPFRVLDIACGSGSFLLGAYQFLLEHCLKWYQDNPSKRYAKSTYRNAKEELHLTIAERKRILTTHIYGVDIDRQAVETTKLSLLLKALEGETDSTLSQQMLLFHERALPNLSSNIKCGNSLIASDFSVIPDDLVRVHAFDWPAQFPDTMKAGGFDCIIGNPPYIFARELITESEKDYYNRVYRQTQFKINTYQLFIEKGSHLLNGTGRLGFIIPNNWLTIETASQFRHFILSETSSIQIVNSYDKVFEGASVDTSILIFAMTGQKEVTICELTNRQFKLVAKNEPSVYLSLRDHVISYEAQKYSGNANLCQKILRYGISLEDIAEVRNGIQAYTVGEATPPQTEQMKINRVYHSLRKKDKTWIKYVDGVDVGRFELGWSKQFVKYGPNLSRPRKKELFEGERLLIRQIPASPPYSILTSYVDENLVNDNNSMIVLNPQPGYGIKYLIGILNSKLMSFWFIHSLGKLQRKVFPQFKVNELRVFPIRPINFFEPAETALHDRLVAMVEKMLTLKPKLRGATSESEKAALQNAITTTDAEIDRLVYELYGLTEEEIKIVEGEG